MGKEIERKFLVDAEQLPELNKGTYIHQGFLNSKKERVVRVRVTDRDAFLTIKGIAEGATRKEFEYNIPLDDAKTLLEELCEKPTIEKYRYLIHHGGFDWELDIFEGKNNGLIIAEIELDHEDQKFDKPVWAKKEVTGDPKYYNSNLVENPYCDW